MCRHWMTTLCRQIRRYRLFRVTVKIIPVVFLERAFTYLCMIEIDGNLPLWVDLEVAKDSVWLLEMALSCWHRHVCR